MSDATIDEIPSYGYAGPLAMLLDLPADDLCKPDRWPDYPRRYGLEREHIPDLIRMARDMTLHNADGSTDVVWAPVHAWRALAQMGASECAGPLLDSMQALHETEAPYEELVDVFQILGPATIPALGAAVASGTVHSSPACIVMDALVRISRDHPAHRDACIAAVVRVLEQASDNRPATNGWAVVTLLDLNAVETIDTIRRAFALDAVDQSMAGDVEDAEIALGLRKRRTTPAKLLHQQWGGLPDDDSGRMFAFAAPREAVQQPVSSPKIGRNEACPCGSGKKYKKCCLV